MTGQELIKKWSDDIEVSRARAEDFLLSLRDIVVSSLLAHESVPIAGLGAWEAGNGSKAPFYFRFASELRAQLGLPVKTARPCSLCARARVAHKSFCREHLNAYERDRRRRKAAKTRRK